MTDLQFGLMLYVFGVLTGGALAYIVAPYAFKFEQPTGETNHD